MFNPIVFNEDVCTGCNICVDVCLMERQESRRAPFGFYRADFPEQNDKEWQAFLALKKKEGRIEFSRIPIKP